MRYIKQKKKAFYLDLNTSGKLNSYLAELNDEAEKMFSRLVKQMAKKQGITEQLKSDNQMEWVARMNNIRYQVIEIIKNELINE